MASYFIELQLLEKSNRSNLDMKNMSGLQNIHFHELEILGEIGSVFNIKLDLLLISKLPKLSQL